MKAKEDPITEGELMIFAMNELLFMVAMPAALIKSLVERE
jgi:hypothetical protein